MVSIACTPKRLMAGRLAQFLCKSEVTFFLLNFFLHQVIIITIRESENKTTGRNWTIKYINNNKHNVLLFCNNFMKNKSSPKYSLGDIISKLVNRRLNPLT